jgi:2'-5' RNA ligase
MDVSDMPEKRFNLFFALFPDLEATEKIDQLAWRLCDVHHLKDRPLRTNLFHISLQSLGKYKRLPNNLVENAGRAAASIEAKPFNVTFGKVESFDIKSDRFPLVLFCSEGLAALQQFQQELGIALKHEDLGRFAAFHFTPHMTLLYGDRTIEEHPVGPIGWRVKEFALVLSHFGESRYDILGQWPLRIHGEGNGSA